MTATTQALRSTAIEILEARLAVFLEEDNAPPEDDMLVYAMSIRGADNAEVGIQASREAARVVAAHMLGVPEQDVVDNDIGPALAEALNMVAGALVVHTVGPRAELDLLPPVAGGDAHGTVVAFRTDAGPLRLWYSR